MSSPGVRNNHGFHKRPRLSPLSLPTRSVNSAARKQTAHDCAESDQKAAPNQESRKPQFEDTNRFEKIKENGVVSDLFKLVGDIEEGKTGTESCIPFHIKPGDFERFLQWAETDPSLAWLILDKIRCVYQPNASSRVRVTLMV